MGASDFELRINRKLTDWFISRDPSEITLQTRIKQNRPGGSHRWMAGPSRLPQSFKIIYPGGDGIVITAEGKTRRFDFIIVGSYDADLAIDDFWVEGDQKYVIEYLFPYNGYEVKGGGVTHGSEPNHG
ncbi:hypothetical protein PBI_DAMIEN_18 [Mycobacterium phage Damien]|uniref:Head-to-tail stopper n=1 Tax=Mycobacterium phage Konstantine TaxID=563121 RepID=B5U4Z3_9CAUD|nr:gp23 [Mycobacterium phage Konstantine]YP_009007299.1 hypothetical protein CH12_gp18 [Mycobacterium phage Oaker]YP_009044007.1 hypothetical protein HL12_gp18 [Mycobacterium phage Damien]AXH47143.1 hypothetical protein SEA_CBORCH11_19 [Mycobacterium phage Cborch11]QDH84882.1 hypothetical protein SEA_Phreeze_18 [Mycobacterium phage Phreeze]QLF83903.1 hypothetical protein SEA_BECKERTON_18 [Mycobacterium phage Beckerton]ACI12439.1 hypothetical protein KONSTANTINE_23 [Mycobacterium phage Konstan